VILRVNSPGGSPVQAGAIYERNPPAAQQVPRYCCL
jgi:ClpP class serine protease